MTFQQFATGCSGVAYQVIVKTPTQVRLLVDCETVPCQGVPEGWFGSPADARRAARAIEKASIDGLGFDPSMAWQTYPGGL